MQYSHTHIAISTGIAYPLWLTIVITGVLNNNYGLKFAGICLCTVEEVIC